MDDIQHIRCHEMISIWIINKHLNIITKIEINNKLRMAVDKSGSFGDQN